MNKVKIIQIATHQNPHLDEHVAIMCLRRHGEEKFPGISTAKIVTWGKKDLARTPPEAAAMQGILLVGIGGGMFDEHGRDGKRQDSAAGLVAKCLGLDRDPVWQRILQDVFQADSKATGPLQPFAEEIKSLNRYWVGAIDVEKVYALIEPFILSRLARQEEYLAAKRAYKKARQGRINGVLTVAVEDLDNKQFQHVARSQGAKLIIQRASDGLTQIFGDEGLDMAFLAARVRSAEISASRINLGRFVRDEEFFSRGTMSVIPQWYYEGGFLLNGSESFTDVPPSQIPFDDLLVVVDRHLRELPNGVTQDVA